MTRAEVDMVDSDGPSLGTAREIAVEVAEEAGLLLISRFGRGVETSPKGDAGDVVTDLDLAAEDLIVTRLRALFPTHRIVAEESGVHQVDGAPGEWTWLVDPLDGTNNVAVGLPAFVVGLALCSGSRPVVGVVHDPVTRQTWSAVCGLGADGPNGRLGPLPRHRPHGPVLGWTQGHDVTRSDATARALKLALELNSYRLLQLWAPLLCWVMLARGHIDGFVGYQAESLDLPAGSIIAREAGLSVVSFDGSPFTESVIGTTRYDFVASHPDRLTELLALVHAADGLTAGMSALTLKSSERVPWPAG